MALTCPNGHVNDEGNRFCEQCGAPLQAAQETAAPPVTAAPAGSGSAATSSTCPVCGQENVPGTAFCDNCGAALPPPAPTTSAEVPSVSADVAQVSTSSAPAATATITCPQCGTENDAANRFCDNCGAKLSEADTALPVDDAQAAVAADQTDQAAQPAATSQAAPDLSALPGVTVPPTPVEATAPESPAAATSAPALEAPASATSAPTDVAAERQRLEEVVRTQQQVVSQLEQTQNTLGAATPAAIVQALDEARQQLAQAQADLQALPTQAAADPAEVARLEEAVRTQQQVVSQLEQTQSALGAATPAAIVQALDEARQQLAQAQAALQSLTGGASTTSAPSSLVVEAAQPTIQAQPAPAPEAAQPITQAQQPSAPAAPSEAATAGSGQPVAGVYPATQGTDQLKPSTAQPQASGPRFVTRDGSTISLPQTGRELVIGRDDPISGIHPDVDLTPHGGEAGGVSRRHAVMREQNGQWFLTDLDSTNYTRIDGNRIMPDTPTVVHDGARVQFGRLEVDFRAS